MNTRQIDKIFEYPDHRIIILQKRYNCGTNIWFVKIERGETSGQLAVKPTEAASRQPEDRPSTHAVSMQVHGDAFIEEFQKKMHAVFS